MAFFTKGNRNETTRHTSAAAYSAAGLISFPAGSVQKKSKDKDYPAQTGSNLLQRKSSEDALPDKLRSGVEHLSGLSLADVKVHYNSPKPAQLQALAYAQGSEIHVAPGQERHLPHEAWHVAQQKQGRVKPTLQMQKGVAVNDDKSLEDEADVMGSKALQMKRAEPVQRIKEWDKDGDQTLKDYASEIKAEAITIRDTADTKRKNKDFISALIQGISDATHSGVMLQQVCSELYKAIKNKNYKPAEDEEPRYSISSLESNGSLSEDQRAAIEERISARNSGEARFNLHFGVGGVPTMDAGSTFGGKGRGDARLQFFKNGTMKIVDHSNRSWF